MIDEDMSSAALRNVERPWKGVVITFTGVEQKVGQHVTLERGLMIEPNVSSCYSTRRPGRERIDCACHSCRCGWIWVRQVLCEFTLQLPGLTSSTPSNIVYQSYQPIGSRIIISAGLAEGISRLMYVHILWGLTDE
jgi:hypothetical protein